MSLKNSKIIVVKIGSSLLVDSDKKIRKKWLSSFAKDIKTLKDKNQKIVIVSSGAIALGCKKMNINKKTIKLDKSQAIASIGQIELMNLFSETFTKYKLNQFYDWHCDSWNKPYDKPNEPNSHGKIRKLSVTVSLSDETEYEGGDFEFDFRSSDDGSNQPQICKEIRPKGSIVVFPSFVWHRVKPVTSGTRYSLVIWNLGWPFK